jgi:hypothetical protein
MTIEQSNAASSACTAIAPERTASLSPEDLYLFDTMGFVRIARFLSPETVQACRSEVHGLTARRIGGRQDKERFDDLAGRSALFDALATSGGMRNSVEPLINQPYRLIESYALRRERDSSFYLHNGYSEILRYGDNRRVQRNMSLSHTFHDGKLFCMFVKVLIYLTDLRTPEDGPFCYLQGSHKANLPWFRGPASYGEQPILTPNAFPSLQYVLLEAGDALLLNEALLHGTLHKVSGGERLVTAFSYAPAFVTDWNEVDRGSMDIRKLGHY